MDWDKDNDGNIVAAPLTTFQVAAFEDQNAVMARFQVEQTDGGPPAMQVSMDPKYALALAEDLRRAAETVLKAGGAAAAVKH